MDAVFGMGVSCPTAPKSGKGKDKLKPWLLSPRGIAAKKTGFTTNRRAKARAKLADRGRPASGSLTTKAIGAICAQQQRSETCGH